jgi:processive 1,2-diacylglycerol beta-glucosyltransferase
MAKHLLLLSVSAGAGHMRAAEAIAAAARARFPTVQVTHLDVLDYVPREFRKIYSESYIKLVEKLPQLWSFLYTRADQTDRRSMTDRLRRAVEKLNTLRLRREIEQLRPDAIVCTHFLPAELLSRRLAKGAKLPPVWVQVTDFDVHALWIHPHLSGYFVANDELAWRLADRGIERQRIVVSGIAVLPQFAVPLKRSVCAAELGLTPNRFTVLMMAGGAGVGSLDAMAERLLQRPRDIQLVALAGKNAALLTRLRELAGRHPGKLFPLGYTSTVERVMSACDLVITKPGGLSTSECLAKGLPMLLIAPIPGQEERNADYLLECGAALKAVDAASLEYKLDRLLGDAQLLASLRANALRIGQPQAALTVAERVLAD